MAEHVDTTFESLLRSTLKAEAASVPVRIGAEDVLRRRDQRRRRFGWLTDPRRGSTERGLRLAAILGVLAIAAAVSFVALLGGRPAIMPGASPSPSASPSPGALPDTGGHMHLELEPGAWYADHGFPFRIELSLPELPSGRWEGSVTRPPLTGQPAISIYRGRPAEGFDGMTNPSGELEIAVVHDIYVDPCNTEESPRQPIRSAEELVTWLNGLPGAADSELTPVVVGGLTGSELSGLLGRCPQRGGDRTYDFLADGLTLPEWPSSTITVVEAEGSVVAIRTWAHPGQEDVEEPALAAAVGSIRFLPSVEEGPAPTPQNPWPGRTLEPGVTPQHSAQDVEAKVMGVIERSERILGRLADPSIRVTLVAPGNVYLTYQADGSPAGGIGPGDELLWVAEFEGTYASVERAGAFACTAGILLYTDERLGSAGGGCRDPNPRPIESPPLSIWEVNP